jgi:hypothetical protein
MSRPRAWAARISPEPAVTLGVESTVVALLELMPR